ncbi:MAG TPA: hypothetical protein VMI94_03940 [Bryobacteraceae bacterium]|nr:hypothetical protein [Bryobacteraceae bacterium]
MRLAWVAAGIAIAFQAALAQKPPIAGGGGSRVPGSIPPSAANSLGQPSAAVLNRNLYLSGKVVLEDGTPPPQPVTIERVCGGAPRALAYTDQRGEFSFQLGHTATVNQDASEEDSGSLGAQRLPGAAAGSPAGGLSAPTQYNLPDSQLASCDLRAVLAGYRSDSVPLGERRIMDDPHVGTIVLHRISGDPGTVVSVTTLEAPKDARKAYDKGLQAVRQAKLADAGKLFQKAVTVDPKFAAAWYELGKVQQQSQEADLARQSYDKAIAADSHFMGPYEQITQLALNAGNWRELADTTQRLLELDSAGHPAAYFYNAMANLKLNRVEAAEKSARAGEKADPDHRYPKREQVLAVILAHRRDFAGAAAHLRVYLQYASDADDAGRMRLQLAEYERLAGGNEQAQAAAGKAGKPDPGKGAGNPGPP